MVRPIQLTGIATLTSLLLVGVNFVACSSGELPDTSTPTFEEPPTAQPNPTPAADQQAGVPWLRPAQPIVRPMSEWTLEETAEDALGRMGSAAVPMLIEKLRYEDPEPARQASVRRQAAEVIARIGPQAQAAVPELIKALDDPSVDVRKSAAFALGQIGPAASSAAPALLRTMLEAGEQPEPLPPGVNPGSP